MGMAHGETRGKEKGEPMGMVHTLNKYEIRPGVGMLRRN